MTHLCSSLIILLNTRTPNFPWTNGLIENQNRNHGIQLRLFLQDPPTISSFRTQLFASDPNSIPLPQVKRSPYQIAFHAPSHIPLFSSPFTQSFQTLYCFILCFTSCSYTL